MGCLQYLNPYGACKLIMHALKLYGPSTGRQNLYLAALGPCGPRECTCDFCSKQPGHSPHGARECDLTAALCLSHIQPRAPYDVLHPYDILPVRPSEAPVGILRRCCSRDNIRLQAPYGLTRLYTYVLIK